jgi:branched-chain amino acid transport system substrate-binding protein
VNIGLDLELGHVPSTSALAIQRGAEIAIAELNAGGGVLGGRPLQALVRDNRSVPARGVENLRELLEAPDLVAVIGGKFSPVVLEQLPLLHEKELPMLVAWAAADGIVDNGRSPSFVFRLAARDSWAVEVMLRHAAQRGLRRVGLMLPNTAWGRSNEAAVRAGLARREGLGLVGTRWHNWGVKSLVEDYQALRAAGAQALLLVTNETEGALLIREMAALPAAERLPLLSHHGLAGGDLPALAGPALHEVDLAVVQIFGFVPSRGPRAARLLEAAQRAYGCGEPACIPSAAGLAAAYDLVHLLARAVDRAGTTDRRAIRSALEELGPYDGAVKRFERPFGPRSHEALTPRDLYLARYDRAGLLVRIPEGR